MFVESSQCISWYLKGGARWVSESTSDKVLDNAIITQAPICILPFAWWCSQYGRDWKVKRDKKCKVVLDKARKHANMKISKYANFVGGGGGCARGCWRRIADLLVFPWDNDAGPPAPFLTLFQPPSLHNDDAYNTWEAFYTALKLPEHSRMKTKGCFGEQLSNTGSIRL